MNGVDPDTMLEWLQAGHGEDRDLQLMALEQLCMLLLMSDNIDRCFDSCPPRVFLPALGRIFIDETAPENVLEVTARAITYYLDVSNECTRRITQVEGAVRAICGRLAAAEIADRTNRDLVEQCVKLLEHICQREATAVYEANGLPAMLHLVRHHDQHLHRDTMHSAMNVITRLCSKVDPADESLPGCGRDLGTLLAHDDPMIAECALRCFAALADRFIRRAVDPAELAVPCQLVSRLLDALAATASESITEAGEAVKGTPRHSPAFVSVVLSLISNLCRGSAAITTEVTSSPTLIPAIKSVLGSRDERCVMDSLRLADLLIVLLCEGRGFLPKSAVPVGSQASVSDGSGGDRLQRQLIDTIRQHDTDALIDAVERGTVDVNFVDDVGQTLLNWCSAFGTAEMVQFLVERGADPNRGQRSSSLHYAACFGRIKIVKILLQHGANPDLHDEEGRTALEKARERNDDGHRAVIQILECPNSYTVATGPPVGPERLESVDNAAKSAETVEPPIDRQLAVGILQQMIPMFCDIYQNSLLGSVRRATLILLRKCIAHLLPAEVSEMTAAADDCDVGGSDFAAGIMSVIGVAFAAHGDDADPKEQALLIIKNLFEKDQSFWLDQLIRLGIYEKVEKLAHDTLDESAGETPTEFSTSDNRSINALPLIRLGMESQISGAGSQLSQPSDHQMAEMLNISVLKSSGEIDGSPTTVSNLPTTASLPDEAEEAVEETKATEMSRDVLYKWHGWRLLRHGDAIFLWCDVLLIELSEGSNGWLRYLMNGRLNTMFSSGKVKGAPAGEGDGAAAAELTGKLRRAKLTVIDRTEHQLLVTPLAAGNWRITEAGESLNVTNVESALPARRQLRVDAQLPGFTFTNGRDVTRTFSAETSLGPEYVTGWPALNVQSPLTAVVDAPRHRLAALARQLWDDYLKKVRTKERQALVALRDDALAIGPAVDKNDVPALKAALSRLRDALADERRLSTFELSAAGVVPALLRLLEAAQNENTITSRRLVDCFSEVFSDSENFRQLVRRIVAILEQVERFPQPLYDAPGGSAFGLQLLMRRFQLRMALKGPAGEPGGPLLDRTNRTMRAEPLAKIGALRQYVYSMVMRSWYDRPRAELNVVRELRRRKTAGEPPMVFVYESDFDMNGLIWYLGTNGRTANEWTNPAVAQLVNVYSSNGPSGQPRGRSADVLSRDVVALDCRTSDSLDTNFTIDLGVWIYPTKYTLRHAFEVLRSWYFQGSRDAVIWDVLTAHNGDGVSLNAAGDTATFTVGEDEDEKSGIDRDHNRESEPQSKSLGRGPYRYVRIVQNGRNAGNVSHVLALSGFEVYGTVMDVVDTELKPLEQPSQQPAAECASSSTSLTLTDGGTVALSSLIASKKQRIAASQKNISVAAKSSAATVELPTARVFSGIGPTRPPSSTGAGSMAALRHSITARKQQRQQKLEEDDAAADTVPSLRQKISYSAGTTSRLRMFRTHRGRPSDTTPSSVGESMLRVGTRVAPGPDSTLQQDAVGLVGTVVGVEKSGWVNVQWDDGSISTYRFGHDGKYEVDLINDANSKITVGKPLPYSSLKSAKHFSLDSVGHVPNLSAIEDVEDQPTPLVLKQPADASVTTISQKSMSTTNLFDEMPPRYSVASSKQAASAESLQHQTPSLENLLARSRLGADRIVEVVGDELPSPTGADTRPLDNCKFTSLATLANVFAAVDIEEAKRDSVGDLPTLKRASADAGVGDNLADNNRRTKSVSEPNLLESAKNGAFRAVCQKSFVPPPADDYLKRFLSSSEFCQRLNAAESGFGSGVEPVAEDSTESGDRFLDDFVEDAIFREFMMANRSKNELSAQTSDSFVPSATSTSALTRRDSDRSSGGAQQQLTSLSSGIKARLGTYADVLRGVVQQVVESSSGMISTNFDSDPLADELFDDDFLDAQQNLIENNCDDGAAAAVADEFLSRNFYADMESLASATAAIHQHLASRGTGGGDTPSTSSTSLSALMAVVTGVAGWNSSSGPATTLAGQTSHAEPKLNWRQLFLGSAGSRDESTVSESTSTGQGRAQRVWDDDYVLRRQFGALIPAFDPRPGRTNINQTQEVELSEDSDLRYVRRGSIVRQLFHGRHPPFRSETEAASRLRLFLTGPNVPNIESRTIELADGEETIFRAIQRLCAVTNWRPCAKTPVGDQQQANHRIWEPTYTIEYEYCEEEKTVNCEDIKPSELSENEIAADDSVEKCLQLMSLLKAAAKHLDAVDSTIFLSSKLTQKLHQCLADPLLVAGGALPSWCDRLINERSYLFVTETKVLHLKATAFGTSRAIDWLQNRRDQIVEQNRASSSTGGRTVSGYRGRDDPYPEYRIGRLRHERIKVHRDESALLANATRVMNFHAMRKSVLEIEFYGEEGTGLGPTLEFYALVAAEFQRKSLALWLCDDADKHEALLEADQIDIGEGMKPPGYYIRRTGGLFPAYCPQGSLESAASAAFFRTLGTFLAKVLLDGRLVDIPLSTTFLDLILAPSVAADSTPNLSGVLDLDDLERVQPLKAKFLRGLKEFAERRSAILASDDYDEKNKKCAINTLRVAINGMDCHVEDLALSFVLNPPSTVFKWEHVELIPDGANVDVTAENVQDYVAKCVNFYLNVGIREQVIAFREGFDAVFPLRSLTSFTSHELRTLLFGEQCPEWTQDDLLRYTEPKLGYTRESPVYLRFVNVLAAMNGAERKAFLQFATGCASLPPGGLANLHPRLTIVRKVDADAPAGASGGGDGAYPSVNTCVHYLKLPEYSSAEVLRERLMAATHEKGFHLN